MASSQTDNRASTNRKIIFIGLFSFILGSLFVGRITSRLHNQTKKLLSDTTQAYEEQELKFKELQSYIDDYKSEYQYKIIGDCNGEKCLYEGRSAVEGYGYFDGYYSQLKQIFWNDEHVTCDVLVVTGGSEELIEDLKAWVNRGNSVNKIDNEGKLIVNIDLEKLSPQDSNIIKNSNLNNPVKINLVRVTPQGGGASYCASFIDIVGVN
jgi:nitrate reductase NapAB chaperone NapD